MTTVLKLKLSTFWLFTILFIGNGATVAFAAPAEDFSELLSLVPPNKEATIEYTDSYGNPIATPDGKKVVNAKETSALPTTPLTQFETLANTDPNIITSVQNHQSPTQSFLSKITSNIKHNKLQPEQRPASFKPSGFVPLSNGNFNYPNISQDILIINKIASKYKTTLPKLEPLAVAEEPVTSLPNRDQKVAPVLKDDDTQKIAESSQIFETVFDESKVPDWIAAFNDPNVGPAQPYIPDPNMSGLSVITWGLVPPVKESSEANSSPKEGNFEITKQSVIEISKPTTPRPTTTTTRFTTTRRTTTTTTTTTRKPTTTRATTTTTRRTTTSAPITNNDKETDIYSLENHVQGHLPAWLADYNDTDLASGVPYEIPADLNEVKNTVTLELTAPLAPFTDLAPLKLPSSLLSTTKRPIFSSFSIPTSTKSPTTTTRTTTTTTKRPTTTTRTTTTTTPSTTTTTSTSTTTTESPLIPASDEKNVFKPTLPPWLADFNDPDVGPGVPYVFKDEDGKPEGGSQGIVESSSNLDVVVSSTTPSNIFSSTTATPTKTFTVPSSQEVKGHLASNSVFPSTATTTHFQKASQPPPQNFQSQFLNRNSISNAPPSSPTPFKQSSFSFTPPSPSAPTSPPAFTSSPTKFHFGGAPGILGEQSTPGFGVRPSSFSVSRPAATQAPAASSVVEHKVLSSDRYHGGFGGPPGILSPYDNVQKTG